MRLASLPLALALTPALAAETIGFDDRSSCSTAGTLFAGPHWDELRALVTGMGHTIVPLSGFDAASLAGLDAVFVRNPAGSGQGFVGTEIADLQAFVAAGGGLLVSGEGGCSTGSYVSQLNQLVGLWGVSFGSTVYDPSGRQVSGILPHAITAGVGTIGVDYHRAMTSIVAPAVDLTSGGGGDEVLAVIDAASGGGNVVVMTDLTGWMDVDSGADYRLVDLDNTLLATNVFDFLAGDPLSGAPASVSLASGGSQVLSMDVGPALAGMSYQILGSATGTAPGVTYSGVNVPLNVDPYLVFTLLNPNSPILNGSGGALNSLGQATAVFALPPASDPSLAGLTVHHAGVVLDLVSGSLVIVTATNAAPCLLAP